MHTYMLYAAPYVIMMFPNWFSVNYGIVLPLYSFGWNRMSLFSMPLLCSCKFNVHTFAIRFVHDNSCILYLLSIKYLILSTFSSADLVILLLTMVSIPYALVQVFFINDKFSRMAVSSENRYSFLPWDAIEYALPLVPDNSLHCFHQGHEPHFPIFSTPCYWCQKSGSYPFRHVQSHVVPPISTKTFQLALTRMII